MIFQVFIKCNATSHLNNCENLLIKYIQQSESAIKHLFLNSQEFKFTCFRTLHLCNNVASYTKQDFLAISFSCPFLLTVG